MVTPQRDKAWCHTVAYTSAILAGAALAAEIAEVDLDARRDRRLVGSRRSAPGEAEREVARAMRDLTLLQTVGSGADRTTARELALKIEEGARRPAVARDLETLLHGHFVACGPDTGLIVILTDGRGGERVLAPRGAGNGGRGQTRHARRRDTLTRAAAAIPESIDASWTNRPPPRDRLRCLPCTRYSEAPPRCSA